MHIIKRRWTWLFVLAVCLQAPTQGSRAEPAVSWNGPYLGFNIGYAFGHSDPFASYIPDPNNNAVPAPLPRMPVSSATGGLQFGYNAQLGVWLVGGEIDLNWLRARANAFVDQFWSTDPHQNFAILSSRYDWLSTARLRMGALAAPNLLVYATGGLAVTRVQDNVIFTYPTYPSTATWGEARTLYGVAFGGGFEYALTSQWSVKAEYLHAQFNDMLPQSSMPHIVAGSPVVYHHDLDIVRAGVNYRWSDAPMPPPSAATTARNTWTGFYVGLNAGYAAGHSDPFETADNQCAQIECLVALPNVRPNGFIGGGQIGYNRQAGLLVVGAELDFSGLSAKNAASVSPLYRGFDDTGTFSSRHDWLFTARLRAGIAPIPDVLAYATVGLAVTRATDSAVDTNVPYEGVGTYYPTITAQQTMVLYGAAFGGGIEYALSAAWSLKLEYLQARFNKTAPRWDILDGRPDFTFEHRLDIVRAGFNYRFD